MKQVKITKAKNIKRFLPIYLRTAKQRYLIPLWFEEAGTQSNGRGELDTINNSPKKEQ